MAPGPRAGDIDRLGGGRSLDQRSACSLRHEPGIVALIALRRRRHEIDEGRQHCRLVKATGDDGGIQAPRQFHHQG